MTPERLPTLPLAVLGATSRIASDFILSAASLGLRFALWARRPDAVAAFLAEHGLPAEWNRGALDGFGGGQERFGGVLNFVGVGDPARARDMGPLIFEATRGSDAAVLGLLGRAPETPYLFMSSGAVYGGGFDRPADETTPARLPVNRLEPADYYSVAKLYAEATHRAAAGRTIIDVRIFNYLSRRLDPDARFLITDMVRAIRSGTTFETTDQPLTRDYLHPKDFRDLVLACLGAPAGTNASVDAYTRAPIAKRELLDLMRDEFGLSYRFTGCADTINATGAKPHYYSRYRAAAKLGYEPGYSSADTVRSEIGHVLRADRQTTYGTPASF